MRLTLRLYAGLRERAGVEELVLDELPEPLDVSTLKSELERRFETWGSLASVRAVVGTSWVADDTALADGQEISLLPPVSGGLDEELEEGVFELRAQAIDPAEAGERVAHPAFGASVLFTGTTREVNREKQVVRLDYESFEEMAGAEMQRVFAECKQRFGPEAGALDDGLEPSQRRLRMLVLHRSGSVGVGEPSVVIAVASPHRRAAFAACAFLIDELKARVPLWKKEVYADGHHWIGDRP